jgi:hypothetical protein
MPIGVQQQIEGLLCRCCDAALDVEEYAPDLVMLACEDCRDEYFLECESCYNTYLNYANLPDPNNPVRSSLMRIRDQLGMDASYFVLTVDDCETACENCYSSCEGCGEAYTSYDAAQDCCYDGEDERHSAVYVHSYSYRPTPKFFTHYCGINTVTNRASNDVLYMGMEIEVEKMMPHADEFYSSLTTKQEQFVYMKTDGSLSHNGVEIVTMPGTLDSIRTLFPFDSLDNARNRGARSFYYGNCGFHIHVSRSAFSPTHMWKFVKFQINNPSLCQTVGQRNNSSYAHWNYQYRDKFNMGDGLPSLVKGKSANGDRYVAINFQNHATVELRYFKGNILKAAILKNVEFVQSIYDYTKHLTAAEVMTRHGLSELSYLDWLGDKKELYPNLIQFIDSNSDQGE